MSDVTPTRKQYPEWTDFDVDSIMYGLGAPFVGMGVYTLDKKFSWPDPECTSENEYRGWESHLLKQGYEIPERYKDAFVKYKGEG